MEPDLEAVVEEWRRLFNRQDYYEAHEVSEDLWHRAAEPEKTFLKGLIHAAVSLCHLQRGNPHGARVKHLSAVRYLRAYSPSFGGLDVEGLCRQMDAYLEPLHAPDPRIPEGPSPRAEPSCGLMLILPPDPNAPR